ncbi:MAG: tRNA (adenosine(37)-N6)-dimethylallyltransferase MiaA [Bacteroidales bacterium]|nr:tRNA (adenosine(37)-N6)-dimethylallyltransferase MiaA [Bacteroidales bacterium]
MAELQPKKNTLLVIAGPTAVGKTAFAIRLAKALNSVIISADSRQFYSEMSIGTAKPTIAELNEVQHYFIGQLSIHQDYNVSNFEQDALRKLEELFQIYPLVIMTGGSGLYIDVLCKGVDDFPDPSPELRAQLKELLRNEGISALQNLLLEKDPAYYQEVDLANPNRLIRALEVCITTGKSYSSQRKNSSKERPFEIVKVALNLPREILFSRINLRVEQMMERGLLDEARSLFNLKHLNALNTVGYKELFSFFEGNCSLEQAVTDIKTNTRRYAKRQLTWFKKDPEYSWISPEDETAYQTLLDRFPKNSF